MTTGHHYIRAIRYHLLALAGAMVVLVSISLIYTNSFFGERRSVAQTGGGTTIACPNLTRLAAKDGDLTVVDPLDVAWFEYYYASAPTGNLPDRYQFVDVTGDGVVNANDRYCVYNKFTSTARPTPVNFSYDGNPWQPKDVVVSGYQYPAFTIPAGQTATKATVWIIPLPTAAATATVAPTSLSQIGASINEFSFSSQITGSATVDRTITLPFDTMVFPRNDRLAYFICVDTVTCSPVQWYVPHHQFTISTPSANATVPGNFAASVYGEPIAGLDLHITQTDVTPNVERAVVHVAGSSRPTTSTTTVKYSGTLPSTTGILANGHYRLTLSYQPIDQATQTLALVTSPAVEFTVQNTATTATNLGTSPNGATPAVSGTTNTGTNTNSKVTNTSASTGVIIAATISNVIPASGTVIDRLVNIEGSTSRAGFIQASVGGTVLPTLATTTTISGFRFALTLPTTVTLSPGQQDILLRLCETAACTTALAEAKSTVTIQPPTGKFLVADGQTLSGQVIIPATVSGYIKRTEVVIDRVQGLSNVSLGPLIAATEGGKPVWRVTMNTLNLPGGDGNFILKIRMTGADDRVYYSAPLAVTVKNTIAAAATPPVSTVVPPTSAAVPVPHNDTPSTGTTPSPTTTAVKPTASAPSIEVPKINTDPRTTGTVTPEKLHVQKVENTQPAAEEKNLLTFSGVGPPNSVVTIFIYSDPIIVTTRTDANGNWVYSLDGELGNGQHQAYVTVTNDTGKVVEKSNPLSFFVSKAQAVTEQEFLANNAAPESSSDSLLRYYLIMAGLLVGLAVMAIVWWRMGHRSGMIA